MLPIELDTKLVDDLFSLQLRSLPIRETAVKRRTRCI